MSVDTIVNSTAIELSDEELEVVAGGVVVGGTVPAPTALALDTTNFNQSTQLINQATQSGMGGSSTVSSIANQKTNTAALHAIALF